MNEASTSRRRPADWDSVARRGGLQGQLCQAHPQIFFGKT